MTLSIGGLVPFSTVDYPGALAAVVFCQGCPWSCSYCQNPHLQPILPAREWVDVRDELRLRRGLLEAVVFSGGEPLMQPDLGRALADIRRMGFRAGLHTGGCDPVHLEALLPHLDWVGLDIKAPRHLYPDITGSPGSGEQAWKSLALLQSRRVSHEVRTTWHPDLLEETALSELALALAKAQVQRWDIQVFRPEGCANRLLRSSAFPQELQENLASIFPGKIYLRSGSPWDPPLPIQELAHSARD